MDPAVRLGLQEASCSPNDPQTRATQPTANICLNENVRGRFLRASCSLRFSLIWVKISSSRHLLFPTGHCLPLYPTDGTLRHWVCFPKPQRAIAAIQGKPSLHWHSFEHASHTTSHGLEQRNVDFSQSFYSSVAELDLIGCSPLYFLVLYNHPFSQWVFSSRHFKGLDYKLQRVYAESLRLKSSRQFRDCKRSQNYSVKSLPHVNKAGCCVINYHNLLERYRHSRLIMWVETPSWAPPKCQLCQMHSDQAAAGQSHTKKQWLAGRQNRNHVTGDTQPDLQGCRARRWFVSRCVAVLFRTQFSAASIVFTCAAQVAACLRLARQSRPSIRLVNTLAPSQGNLLSEESQAVMAWGDVPAKIWLQRPKSVHWLESEKKNKHSLPGRQNKKAIDPEGGV